MIIQTMIGTAGSEATDPGGMKWNTSYNGGGILDFDNFDKIVYDQAPGIYSTITDFQIPTDGKYMWSFKLLYYTDPASLVGIANASVDTYNYLGYTMDSIGLTSDGILVAQDTPVATGFPTFTNEGDVIDVCFDNSLSGDYALWIRVNGGDWNNDTDADPATGTNGILCFFLGLNAGPYYPALSVGGFDGPSEFQIQRSNQYPVPSGFTFVG